MTLRRQFLLQNQWYFSCECRRCQDPTECDTMGNSIICTFCKNDGDAKHFMLPKNPRDQESEWICRDDSSHVSQAKDVKALIAKIEANIEQMEKVCFHQTFIRNRVNVAISIALYFYPIINDQHIF